MAAREPDLAPVISLQRELVGIVTDVAETLGRSPLPRLSLPARYLAAKLARGVPAAAREPIPVPVTVLEPALLRLCRALASGGWGEPADHVHSALAEGRLDAASVLATSLARNQHAIRAGAAQHGFAPDLLWLAAELAVSPYVHALQRALMPPDCDPALAAALERWRYGYCPLCGSWPALAEVVASRPLLRCSFCNLAWDLPVPSCAYCGESGERFTSTTLADSSGDRRLELCSACSGYLKVLDVAALSPFPLVAVSDLETMDLDVAAMERGYSRPILKDFALPITPR
jgi:FdhE protein